MRGGSGSVGGEQLEETETSRATETRRIEKMMTILGRWEMEEWTDQRKSSSLAFPLVLPRIDHLAEVEGMKEVQKGSKEEEDDRIDGRDR
uniref:Uncharacterized protein n=1 Tax=Pristionchus pacificus TaxID=54126 RepID=A0A2A6D190_PRIPA|eukprot:PDM84148.1 hypothetical protein PRIPAC_34340 [Pristionchus pacificus]